MGDTVGGSAVQLLRDSFRCPHSEPGRCQRPTSRGRRDQVEGGQAPVDVSPQGGRLYLPHLSNDEASALLHQVGLRAPLNLGGPVTTLAQRVLLCRC